MAGGCRGLGVFRHDQGVLPAVGALAVGRRGRGLPAGAERVQVGRAHPEASPFVVHGLRSPPAGGGNVHIAH